MGERTRREIIPSQIMFSIPIRLDERDVNELKSYVYCSGPTTKLDRVLDVVAEEIVPYIPRTLSPNTITLFGFFMQCCAVFLLAVSSPEHGGSWRIVLFIDTILSLVYVIADSLDGKQARRLKRSSPLGQLVDHGCDSLNAFCFLYSVIKTTGIKDPATTSLLFAVIGCVFVSFQLIEYFQNVLYFGTPLISVTECELGCILLSLLTSLFGPSLWDLSLPRLPWTLRDSVVAFIRWVIGGAVFLTNIHVIFLGTHLSETQRGRKAIARVDHCKRMIPLLLETLSNET